MSFKEFSNTHNPPAKTKPKNNAETAPIVDHPPAPPTKAKEEKVSVTKP